MRIALPLVRPGLLGSLLLHGAVVAVAWTGASVGRPPAPARPDSVFLEAVAGAPAQDPEPDDADGTPSPRATDPEPWPEPAVAEAPPSEDAPLDFEPVGDVIRVEIPDSDLTRPVARVRHSASPAAATEDSPRSSAPASSARAVPVASRTQVVGAYRLPANAPPEYPAEARARGREGTALVRLTNEADGRVSRATLDASSGWPALDEAAVAAARTWRYSPRLEDEVPVVSTLLQPVDFRLR